LKKGKRFEKWKKEKKEKKQNSQKLICLFEIIFITFERTKITHVFSLLSVIGYFCLSKMELVTVETVVVVADLVESKEPVVTVPDEVPKPHTKNILPWVMYLISIGLIIGTVVSFIEGYKTQKWDEAQLKIASINAVATAMVSGQSVMEWIIELCIRPIFPTFATSLIGENEPFKLGVFKRFVILAFCIAFGVSSLVGWKTGFLKPIVPILALGLDALLALIVFMIEVFKTGNLGKTKMEYTLMFTVSNILSAYTCVCMLSVFDLTDSNLLQWEALFGVSFGSILVIVFLLNSNLEFYKSTFQIWKQYRSNDKEKTLNTIMGLFMAPVALNQFLILPAVAMGLLYVCNSNPNTYDVRGPGIWCFVMNLVSALPNLLYLICVYFDLYVLFKIRKERLSTSLSFLLGGFPVRDNLFVENSEESVV